MAQSRRDSETAEDIVERGKARLRKNDDDADSDESHARRSIELHVNSGLIRHEANRIIRERLSGITAPDLSAYTRSVFDELKDPVLVRPYAVEQLARINQIVTLPSLRKTGKTTLIMNLAADGLSKSDFLGQFKTNLEGNVAIINAEMNRDDLLDGYVRPMRLKSNALKRLFFLHCKDEGIRLNLMNDVTAENFIKWLADVDAEWLVLDPWKNFLSWAGAKMNDADTVNELMDRVQEITVKAGISLCVIPMHITQAPQLEGQERGKGAGELEDSADALWRYTRVGKRQDPRVLAVEGRGGVGLDETEVLFDPSTQLVSLGNGDRYQAMDRAGVEEVISVIEAWLLTPGRGPRIKSGELDGLLSGNIQAKSTKRKAAVESGKLEMLDEGNGKPTWYWIPGSWTPPKKKAKE